jgi:signal transduction histidine kinase
MAVAAGKAGERNGELSMSMPTPRDLAWSVLPVRGAAKQSSAALLVLRDVTAERQAEKLRQDLANMIVHDLRAPLTNMIVSNDLLLKQISGPLTASQQRILEIAGNSSQQMLDLVNALLDIRRLEQRQLEVHQQPVEMFEIVEAVFERLERVAEDRRVRLVNATAPLPPINGDVDLVRRVVQNLVDNATKFSPRDSTVEVTGLVATAADLPTPHPDGRWLIVSISDQGKGVPESYRTVIFELFGQAPTGRGQGTGLGLAFCKLAVAAHGGTIWVDDGPAGGAVFRFSLPLA